MNNYDPLTKARKWLTDAKNINTEGKYFADAKSIKDLSDVLAHGDNFIGSMSEWNALSTAEKVKYKTADIIVFKYTLIIIVDENVDSFTLSPTPINNKYDEGTVVTISAIPKSKYIIKSGTGTVTMDSNKTINIVSELMPLKFSSDDDFILSVVPLWDGIIEYSIDDGNNWSTWDGSQLSGDADTSIYLRGSNNTKIVRAGVRDYKWTFTGKYCTGNIEMLLDYQTVLNGQHPTMTTYCYYSMFRDCTSLITAPELPATTLTRSCYYEMFRGCTSLTVPPELPATILADYCYAYMFQNCISLVIPPKLPANSLNYGCYSGMFSDCSSLTTLPKLISDGSRPYCYASMFYDCSLIKLSTTQTGEYQYKFRIPFDENEELMSTPESREGMCDNMFTNTGGTFTGTPTINTTYYTDHPPVG